MKQPDDFIAFCAAREKMRLAKEAAPVGSPGPFSTDPILSQFHFCNINREHDRVTRWIRKNVERRFDNRHFGMGGFAVIEMPSDVGWLTIQYLICRIFNHPPMLEQVVGHVDPTFIQHAATEFRAQGNKAFRGAYLMVPHGTGGRGQTPEAYYCERLRRVMAAGDAVGWPAPGGKLADIADIIMSVEGIADFVANQVITDMRYAPAPYNQWSDWDTFVMGGPGTRRGLNRFMGATTDDPGNRKFPKFMGDCQPALLKIREELRSSFKESTILAPKHFLEVLSYFEDPNNLSNAFCEYDKYCRAREQLAQGMRLTLRRHTPFPPNP